MLAPRWRKVLTDLTVNKVRTVLVVLSIALGVFAIGTVTAVQDFISRQLTAGYLAASPAHAVLLTEPFGDELVQVVRGLEGVQEAAGRRSVAVRIRRENGEWRDLTLFALPDYREMRINRVEPETGAWPPPEREILLERSSLHPAVGLDSLRVGDALWIELPDGTVKRTRIAGLAHAVYLIPAFFAGEGYGFIAPETLEWLGQPMDYNELHIVVEGEVRDRADVRRVVEQVREKVEKSGRAVLGTEILDPGRHPAHFAIDAMAVLLGALGVFSLLLSGLLVINTIQSMLKHQVRHIGVLKTIGATTGQVTGMYLVLVLSFSVIALAIALPLTLVGAQALNRFAADLFNVDSGAFAIPLSVVGLQVAAGLAAPVLAALYPILMGTRITVRAAISSYGLAGEGGSGLWVAASRRLQFLGRPLLLSLRNTFRQKGRLALTLVTLALVSAIVISVASLRASILQSLDEAFGYWQFDLDVQLHRPYPVAFLEQQLLAVPGVRAVEPWVFINTRRVRPDGRESNTLQLTAVVPGSVTVTPRLVAGRWLLPEDEHAVVIDTNVLREEPDLAPGDELVLKLGGKETTWRVVGVVSGQLRDANLYVNFPYYTRLTHMVGRTERLRVQVAGADAVPAVQRAVEEQLERGGVRVASIGVVADIRSNLEAQFNLIIVFLMVMGLLLAVVGGLGLAGTMSMNVVERMREIGVMWAIGASHGVVFGIVIGEGVIIGLISWAAGFLLALPLSRALSDAIGHAFLNAPFSYRFSLQGALIWLFCALLLAVVSSFFPAWHAARLRILEVLAYE